MGSGWKQLTRGSALIAAVLGIAGLAGLFMAPALAFREDHASLQEVRETVKEHTRDLREVRDATIEIRADVRWLRVWHQRGERHGEARSGR